MEILFNHRDNGACPLCKRFGNNCTIISLLKSSLEKVPPLDENMEIVIYKCPKYIED